MMKYYLTRLIIPVMIAVLFLTALYLKLNKSTSDLKSKKRWHYIGGYMYILYLMAVLIICVGFPSIGEWKLQIDGNIPIFNPNINLVPFIDGLERSQILNIIMFVPFGFLVPALWKKFRKFLPLLFSGILFSLTIEIGQLFTSVRATDIDDLMMNTLGAVCGWFIFKIVYKVISKLESEEEADLDNTKLAPYIYMMIALVCAVFR